MPNFRKKFFKNSFIVSEKLRFWFFWLHRSIEVFVAGRIPSSSETEVTNQLKPQPEQSFSSLLGTSPELRLQEIQSGKLSLEKATEWTKSWCSSHQVESDEDIKRLMVLSRDFAQEGLLVAGHELYQTALEALSRRAESIPTLAGLIIGAKAAIHLGDVQKAQHFTKKLKRHFLLPNHHLYSLVAYVDIWSEGHTDVWLKGARDRSRSSSILKNSAVQVINKGPIGKDFIPDTHALTARILAPSSQDDLTPPSGGPEKTDIAYSNGGTKAWLNQHPPARLKELLRHYSLVSVKSGVPRFLRELGMPHLREAVNPNIFLAGSAHYAQIIALDLLAEGARSIYFTGTTLYLGVNTYRSDQFSYSLDGSKNSPASIQITMMSDLAFHNAWENYIVMQQLFQAGRIQGDELFRQALTQTTRDYLTQLEERWNNKR